MQRERNCKKLMRVRRIFVIDNWYREARSLNGQNMTKYFCGVWVRIRHWFFFTSRGWRGACERCTCLTCFESRKALILPNLLEG